MSEKKEYIERGALKAHYSWLPKDATITQKDFDDIIDVQPAADVEEVVHGEWETDRDTIRCSVCGFGYFPNGYFFKDGQGIGDLILDRCPNCGAKMDGEKEERE